MDREGRERRLDLGDAGAPIDGPAGSGRERGRPGWLRTCRARAAEREPTDLKVLEYPDLVISGGLIVLNEFE